MSNMGDEVARLLINYIIHNRKQTQSEKQVFDLDLLKRKITNDIIDRAAEHSIVLSEKTVRSLMIGEYDKVPLNIFKTTVVAPESTASGIIYSSNQSKQLSNGNDSILYGGDLSVAVSARNTIMKLILGRRIASEELAFILEQQELAKKNRVQFLRFLFMLDLIFANHKKNMVKFSNNSVTLWPDLSELQTETKMSISAIHTTSKAMNATVDSLWDNKTKDGCAANFDSSTNTFSVVSNRNNSTPTDPPAKKQMEQQRRSGLAQRSVS